MNYPKAVLKASKSEDVIEIDPARLMDVDEMYHQIRGEGMFEGKSFFLDDDYDWVIAVDNKDQLCAIPLKKI